MLKENKNFVKSEIVSSEIKDNITNQNESKKEENKVVKSDKIIPKKYLVKNGETLSDICKKFGINKETVIKLNNLRSENYIFANQVIKLR